MITNDERRPDQLCITERSPSFAVFASVMPPTAATSGGGRMRRLPSRAPSAREAAAFVRHAPGGIAHAIGAAIDRRDQGAKWFAAAESGCMSAIEKMLQDGCPVNRRGMFGRTALWLASFWGHLELVKRLLEAEADPTLADVGLESDTPLHCVRIAPPLPRAATPTQHARPRAHGPSADKFRHP